MRDQPDTPFGVLEISSRILRLVMNAVVKAAELFGFWQYPLKNAATASEEMGLPDHLYWVYKCKNPITRVEKGERAENLFAVGKRVVGLPQGFAKQASLTFGSVGDLLFAEGLEHSKDIIFENIADLLFGNTISFANFESPITEQELKKEIIGDKGPPTECCSSDQFDILKGHKGKCFTVLNTANNHMFDMGVEGIETTQRVLSENGIVNIGTNSNADEFGKGKVLVKEGIKLGFVSATFGLNGRKVPEDESYRVNVAKLLPKFSEPELDIVKQQIEDCKKQGCDFIIASLHWGYEFEFFPRKRQIDIAHELVEMGVDAIISHHPHVIQPIEYYQTRRDPYRLAVIAYSLGTLTWRFTAPHLALSAILNLTLAKGSFGDREITYIENVHVTPVFRSFIRRNGKPIARIEKLADHIGKHSADYSDDYITQIKRYVDLVLNEQSSS